MSNLIRVYLIQNEVQCSVVFYKYYKAEIAGL